jgi:aspartate 1-decarboxylase
MIDLGTVRPGSTIRIPFSSFAVDDGASITMTNFAVADILIYKDGSTTERSSTSGFTATTNFDSKTGKHLAIIDLADNTTSGFYSAGSEYLVAIDSVTVDGVTVGGWIARFRIGYPGALLDTTIASVSSQTSFTLTNGPAEDDALNNHRIILHDVASAVQVATAVVADYTGSTKTVTLQAAPTFTIAAGDNVSVMESIRVDADVVAIARSELAATNAKNGWLGLATIGTAQAGASTEITLASGSSAEDNYYEKSAITIIAGTGAGQTRQITAYVGSTKVATVDEAWTTNPSTDSVYWIVGRIV